MSLFAKIAVDLQQALASRAQHGASAKPLVSRTLAAGHGWSVEDILCTCGRHDRSFKEKHASVSIAVVLAGTFQYRASTPSGSTDQLMTPGSLLLGNPGQVFECGHEHADGDRCLSFHFAPEFFESIAADAGVPRGERRFGILRLPPAHELSPVIALACAGVLAANPHSTGSLAFASWEEIAIQLAALAIRSAHGLRRPLPRTEPSSIARITRAVRSLEHEPEQPGTVQRLAAEAGLSPFHFLRTFEQVTGVTPHRYVRRARLRQAATRLLTERSNILDVALNSGFGDLCNFNRAFRGEFGLSPRQFRSRGLPF